MSDLTSRNQWVCWKRGESKPGGRFEKVPCDPFFPHYSMNVLGKSSQWSYEDALWLSDFHCFEVEGIAFVPSEDDPFCFLDLDDCVDLEATWIADWAVTLVEQLDSLIYLTPSGKGIRIVVRGKLANGGGHYVCHDEAGDHVLEAYDRNQMLTVTRKVVDKPIRESQAFLDGLKKINAASSRTQLLPDLPEISLDEDFEEMKDEVKRTLVAHELSPDPIPENLRKVTLISIGGHLLMDGRSYEWWQEFLPEVNSTLLYNKEGQLEGLGEDELQEVLAANKKLRPKVSSPEVQERLDLVSDFLALVRPRMKGAYNTDWSFLKALERQGRKYGSIVNRDDVRIDVSRLTLQGLARIASPRTLNEKVSRLKQGKVLSTGKDKGDRTGHYILGVDTLLSGNYFGLSERDMESMREDSNVIGDKNPHSFTIHTHPFWSKQYGNARGPLYAAIASLGGGGRTGRIALKMGRVDGSGKPNCGSISGLLRGCESEGTLKNPRRGYWHFSEDFEDRLYSARVTAGEFDRDEAFGCHKRDKRARYRAKKREYLEQQDRERKLFDRMLVELEQENPQLASKLSSVGATKPMLVLNKYFVEDKRVKGIIGEEI